jgi:hypothetical protein
MKKQRLRHNTTPISFDIKNILQLVEIKINNRAGFREEYNYTMLIIVKLYWFYNILKYMSMYIWKVISIITVKEIECN